MTDRPKGWATYQMNWLYKSSIALAAGLLLATSACRVQVDPSSNGKDKNVQVHTPFGGVQVKTDPIAAADIGLPPYPGATPVDRKNDHGNGDADVQVGFGNWQMHLKVVKYHTVDSKEQVLAFYKKALGRYGDVIQCAGEKAVGTPTITHQGLGCRSDESGAHSDVATDMEAVAQLKAGSKKHQHIMGIEKSEGGGTDFALVALDLPSDEAMRSKDEPRESN